MTEEFAETLVRLRFPGIKGKALKAQVAIRMANEDDTLKFVKEHGLNEKPKPIIPVEVEEEYNYDDTTL